MEKDLKQFIEQAKKINLSAEERSSIGNSVLNFMKENPIEPNTLPRLIYRDGVHSSFWSNIFPSNLNFASSVVIALVLVLLSGGGVSLGAEKSLPGDILYPVKLGVNEHVRGWFAVSEEAKANWEIKRVGRRLEEAEQLASEGSLSDDVRANLEVQFEAHAEKVKSRIEKFETKENFNAAVDVSSKFETSLKVHQKILDRLEVGRGSKSHEQLEPINAKIRSRIDKTKKNREKVELKARGSVKTESDSNREDNNEKENLRAR